MNTGEMLARGFKRLDQDPAAPAYFTRPELLAALNEGQRLFAFLTLCLEATSPLALEPGTAFYRPRATWSDYLLTLRVATAGGRVAPATILELDALDSAWRTCADAPSHYAALGCNLLAIRGTQGACNFTRARLPLALAADLDVPEIPTACHSVLVDFVVMRVRMKQGGQEFGKMLPYFGRFLDAVRQVAGYTRNRARAEGYDRLPLELKPAEIAALLKAPK